ncbi:MAG TPA: hypothetical protein VI408_07280, partial [Gaiellaceae bacterium]
RMNGPQLKAVLERAYRNYYYYKYVPGYGGYSYYTTCMIDTNSIGKIVYRDGYPALPDGNNVGALLLNGTRVDFTDATKYYLVSTVNYLAAGSCNFNDNGVSLWPLNQIVNDTQYYVRDAVIDYLAAQGTVSPKIEGRIAFDSTAPVTTATAPTGWQNTPAAVTFAATDDLSGVKATLYTIDGGPTQTGTSFTVSADGDHTILYWSVDYAGNVETAHSLVVKVDRTPPVVTYSPSGLVYDATDTVTLTCTATDALSGVVSSTCANVSAPAWQFVVGPKPSATATDAAGNVGTGTAVFTVRPSTHGVSSLVTAWVTKDGIVKSLTAHLDAAAASRARGQDGAADNELAAFRNELAAQGDKALTADHAATLAALSRLL